MWGWRKDRGLLDILGHLPPNRLLLSCQTWTLSCFYRSYLHSSLLLWVLQPAVSSLLHHLLKMSDFMAVRFGDRLLSLSLFIFPIILCNYWCEEDGRVFSSPPRSPLLAFSLCTPSPRLVPPSTSYQFLYIYLIPLPLQSGEPGPILLYCGYQLPWNTIWVLAFTYASSQELVNNLFFYLQGVLQLGNMGRRQWTIYDTPF